MTDYTKLIERLRNVGSPICLTASDAIDALQAENERLKEAANPNWIVLNKERREALDSAGMHANLLDAVRTERDALQAKLKHLQAKLGELQKQEPEFFTRQKFGCEREFCEKPFTTDWQPLYAAPVVEAQHPDDIAVDKFAAAMKAKMAKQRAKGRGGWDDKEDCPTERLQQMLVDHIAKGDPVDVGNFAMMLWNRGEVTAAPKALEPLTDGLKRGCALNEMSLATIQSLQAVSDEYNAWIRYHAAGGDYDDFLKKVIAKQQAADHEDDVGADCTPNHNCNGRMVHLPDGEHCDHCGITKGTP